MGMSYRKINDYSIIGNLRSAVLVSKDGSIDWAPAPFIDSPSIFASLLDAKKGGFWSIAPNVPYTSSQSYIDRSNVLVTTFRTEEGVVKVTDFIPIEREKTFLPDEEDTTFKIKRKVECLEGSCQIEVVFNPRFDYARGVTTLSKIKKGVFAKNGKSRGVLVSHSDYKIDERGASAIVTFKKGESDFFVFRYNIGEVVPEKDDTHHHEEELAANINYWRAWTEKCDFANCLSVGGVWHDIVIRSLLVLKILFFEPVGTVAAAATTSLPEHVGGVRNWDYRFTWLRDSAFVFEAFFRAGHAEEAEKYIEWLMKECGCALDPKDIKIMYGLRGEGVSTEETLPNFEGYKKSRPVRIGNDAYNQNQWDIYGSIIDMIWKLHELKGGNAINESTWRQLCRIADYVVSIWREPDEGLWEVRGGKSHFVYSKVMCWVALDRVCRLKRSYAFPEGDLSRWESERDNIRKEVLSRGWSESKQSFVQSFDSDSLDASLLLLSKVGFIDGEDKRMLSTITAIQKELCYKDTYVYRYTSEDGLPGREGVFLVASFWLVEALVLANRADLARQIFERLLSNANHTGLFSEELNPRTGEFLGNFPQAYTHVGLINSAFLLTEADKR